MQERVQLNISVTREQKLALQALAEGHGTSVTKLVLGLIDQGGVGSVPGPSESAGLSTGLPAGAVEERPKKTRTPSQGSGRPLGGSLAPVDRERVRDAVRSIEWFGKDDA